MSIIAQINAALPSDQRIKTAGAPTQGALIALVTAAARISPEAWDKLPDEAQAWLNKAIKAMNAKKPIANPPEDLNPDKAPAKKADAKKADAKVQTELDLDEEISLDDDDDDGEQEVEEKESEMKSKSKGKDKGAKGKKKDKSKKDKVAKVAEAMAAAPKNKKARAEEAEAAPEEGKKKKGKEKAEKAEKPKREKKEKPAKEPRVLKQGGAYFALKYWLKDQNLSIEDIMKKVEDDGVTISKSTLQVLLYDARLVLRVQADLKG